jgi:RNA polymerase sigma-70 factor (ECF subfamily)
MSDVDDSIRVMREEHWRRLMEAAQMGNHTAYEELLTDLLPMLRHYVRRRWRNPSDVEDVVQDILLSIHGVRQTYDPRRPFMPWLMTIAKRRLIDAARRVSARSRNETTVDIMPETFHRHDAKTEYDTHDDQEAIRNAMSQLPDGQRQAVELMKIQGLSLEEASAVTGKSISSLKVSVHRAIKAMRRTLE